MPPLLGAAVYDDENRLVVAITFNMDLGDAWEHADWPEYPENDDGPRLPLWDQLRRICDDALIADT